MVPSIDSMANGGKDEVTLRSYGGCLTGPVIDIKPGNTLRIFLHFAWRMKDGLGPFDNVRIEAAVRRNSRPSPISRPLSYPRKAPQPCWLFRRRREAASRTATSRTWVTS